MTSSRFTRKQLTRLCWLLGLPRRIAFRFEKPSDTIQCSSADTWTLDSPTTRRARQKKSTALARRYQSSHRMCIPGDNYGTQMGTSWLPTIQTGQDRSNFHHFGLTERKIFIPWYVGSMYEVQLWLRHQPNMRYRCGYDNGRQFFFSAAGFEKFVNPRNMGINASSDYVKINK